MVCQFTIPFTLTDKTDTWNGTTIVSDRQLLYELCEGAYQKCLLANRPMDSKLSITKTVLVDEAESRAYITYKFRVETKLLGV